MWEARPRGDFPDMEQTLDPVGKPRLCSTLLQDALEHIDKVRPGTGREGGWAMCGAILSDLLGV